MALDEKLEALSINHKNTTGINTTFKTAYSYQDQSPEGQVDRYIEDPTLPTLRKHGAKIGRGYANVAQNR